MSISERYFKIDEEECLIHLPVKPNGYAVLILGDRNHFVENSSSFWRQHTARKLMLNSLVEAGYTIFYSNQGGSHWGNDRILRVTERLIQYVLKTEILNKNIHIVAEGMGALLAIRLMVASSLNIRTLVLFNPCIDLEKQMEEEKTNRFFYKRFISEVMKAYEIEEEKVQELCMKRSKEIMNIPAKIPMRVFQVVYQAPYAPDVHVRPFIKNLNDTQLELVTTFYLPGKTMEQFSKQVLVFFRKYEKFSFPKK